MKKKVAFVAINLNVGGTEKALLNMLTVMPKDQFDITLILLENRGEFRNQVPEGVKTIIYDQYPSIKAVINDPLPQTVLHTLKQGRILKGIRYFSFYIVQKLWGKKQRLFHELTTLAPLDIHECYDVAIAYAGPMEFISYLVIEKIKAAKKIQWIHFDLSKLTIDVKYWNTMYRKFDNIFAVSKEGKDHLVSCFPEFMNKTETFLNVFSPELILQMAENGNGFKDNFKGFRILTVGRLSFEKGQDLIIKVLARLKGEGHCVRWYCVGEGPMRSEYEALIKKYSLEEDFILLGLQTNPYPFMKECDLYVQPSRHEGYCLTLTEAKLFKKPIVATNFAGANEQISNNKTGIIVNFDEEELLTALNRILNDHDHYQRIKANLEKEQIVYRGDLNKFYTLLN
ncbi:glycosyltransferase [Pullulanibacillus sp. KACC 23026]|uniref:glycosyltransferase n=1 Tax=Pullulanibacillus sp. KACC 23026 TaxID=3028315 RepID=UPI0023B1E6A5|nr:glycosyltransferase [Pullulanibacillus sp. KACC 23026]WEG11504.1 glycosyltransferase [Pullulanibacillus sp. KACC 23026]